MIFSENQFPNNKQIYRFYFYYISPRPRVKMVTERYEIYRVRNQSPATSQRVIQAE